MTTDYGRLLSGWGRACPSAARVVSPEKAEDLKALVSGPGPFLARGLGRSYGDAAQCAGGTVIDCTAMNGVDEPDHTANRVRVQAGCSLDALLARSCRRASSSP